MLYKSQIVGDMVIVVFHTPNLMNGMDIETIETTLLALPDGEIRRMVLDFRKVEYLSSQALSMIVRLQQKLSGVRGRLALCRLNPKLHEAIRITGLHKLVKVYETRTQAMEMP